MVGKKSGVAQLRELGLERTDNNMDLTSWPQVMPINQKNYYVVRDFCPEVPRMSCKLGHKLDKY